MFTSPETEEKLQSSLKALQDKFRENEEVKMSADRKYFVPAPPVFASDDEPFAVGTVFSTVNRHGASGTYIKVTDSVKATDDDGGIFYTGWVLKDYDDSGAVLVVRVANGTAVTVWTEYAVVETPKNAVRLHVPDGI
jgi:hypothetical protein